MSHLLAAPADNTPRMHVSLQRTARPLSTQASVFTAPRSATIGLRPVQRVELPGASGPTLPLSFAEVEGLRAPIFLPVATTAVQRRPFHQYAAKLHRSAAFEGQEALLESLTHLKEKPARLDPKKPKVAILISDPARLFPGHYKAIDLLLAKVREEGCEPVLVPPLADLMISSDRSVVQQQLARYLEGFDAVIGPGGADVHPRLYREPVKNAIAPNYPRDRFEADFLRTAVASDCFVLAICRSHQLLNAALGGKLAQDVIEEGLSSVTRNQEELGISSRKPLIVKDGEGRVVFEHRVQLVPDSDIANVLGDPASVLTNSYHHQAVKIPGKGLTVTGKVHDFGTGVDTIEATESKNAITVQFHPELMRDDAAMGDLVGAAARRAHVFQLKKQLDAQGRPGALAEALKNATRLLPADLEWARAL